MKKEGGDKQEGTAVGEAEEKKDAANEDGEKKDEGS